MDGGYNLVLKKEWWVPILKKVFDFQVVMI